MYVLLDTVTPAHLAQHAPSVQASLTVLVSVQYDCTLLSAKHRHSLLHVTLASALQDM